MKFGRMTAYELARLKDCKIKVLACIGALLIAFLVIGALYAAQSVSDGQKAISDEQRAHELVLYEQGLEELRYQLDNFGYEMTFDERAWREQEIEKYEFLLETGTVIEDYTDIDNFTDKVKGYMRGGFTLHCAYWSFFPFAVWVVAVALYLFAAERRAGTDKNVFASDVGRKTVFSAKLTVGTVAAFAPWALFSAAFGAVGAFLPYTDFLVYGTGYAVLNGYELFWQLTLGNFAALAILFSAALFSGMCFGRLPSALFCAVGYFVLLISGMLVGHKVEFVKIKVQKLENFYCFPAVGIQNYTAGLNGVFWVVWALNILLAAAMVFAAFAVFLRRDIK